MKGREIARSEKATLSVSVRSGSHCVPCFEAFPAELVTADALHMEAPSIFLYILAAAGTLFNVYLG